MTAIARTDPTVPSLIESAGMRSMRTSGRWFGLAVLGLGGAVLAGLVAFGYQFAYGLGTVGYSDRAFYGIYEANLVAFIGVSYGGALVSAVLRLTNARWRGPITRIAEGMALVSLLVGAAFVFAHMGRPERAWQLLTSPNLSSPVVWDFFAITTYLGATLLFLYLPLVPDLARVRDRLPPGRRRRFYGLVALNWADLASQRRRLEWGTGLLAVLIIPLAVAVHSVLAYTFSMTTRPGWHSTIFAPYFVIGALYSGVALVIIVTAAFRRAYRLEAFIAPRHFLGLAWIMVALGLVYLYLTFSELLTGGYAHTRDEVSIVHAMLEGTYAPAFWSFLVGGLLVPMAIVALPIRHRVPALVVAAALAVAGMWLKRFLITFPPATAPLVDETWGEIQITWVPIVVSIAAIAAIPLGLLILFRFVPILAVDELERESTETARGEPLAEAALRPMALGGIAVPVTPMEAQR